MRVSSVLLAFSLWACDDAVGPAASSVDAGFSAEAGPAPTTRRLINEVSAERDFVELYNPGAPVDLVGWSLVDDGFDPDDPLRAEHQAALSGALPRGARLLVDELPFGIGAEDSIRLLDAEGVTRDEVTWAPGDAERSWCRLPDGRDFEGCTPTPDGPNLPPLEGACGDDRLDPGEACDGTAFGARSCIAAGLGAGELGCGEACRAIDYAGCAPRDGPSPVVLNEVRATDDDPIELFNRGPGPVDLTDWRVADAGFRPGDPTTADQRFDLPGPALLAPGALVVLYRDVEHRFGLSARDGLRLYDPSGALADQADWLDGQAERSYCRVPDGDGPFMACEASFGRPNGQ